MSNDKKELKVEKGKMITMEYKITTEKGALIESSAAKGPLSFIFGQHSLLPGFDAQIEGLKVGDDKTFDLPPEEAFGTLESAPVTAMLKSEFPLREDIRPNKIFKAKTPDGTSDVLIYIVTDRGTEVDVKFLHPLFGKVIHCEIKILDIKEAVIN